MFCNNCGREIDDKAVVCPNCGVVANKQALAPESTKSNTLAIVGFICSFLIPIVGLICSIIGYKKAHEYNDNGKSLALAGIIISSVIIIIAVVFIIIGISSILSLASAIGGMSY